MKRSLKELRARKDVTQAEAARDLGVSLTTYNGWEKDFTKVSVSTAMSVARYYGVTLDDLSFCPELEYNSSRENAVAESVV